MSSTRTTTAIALGLIVLVAAGLRFSALDFGRGVRARPDEAGVLVTLDLMRRDVLGVGFVMYGGGYYYPAYVIAELERRIGTPAASADPSHDLLVALRSWSALLSLLTILSTYAAARLAGGRGAALLAAAIVASAPLVVREAHFAKADTAAAFASALVMLAVLGRSRARGHAALIGVAAGLAVSTKATIGVLPVVFYRLAFPNTASGGLDRRSLVVGGACLVATAALLGTHLLRAPVEAWALVEHLRAALTSAAWLPGGDQVAGPVVYHASMSLRHGCGLGVALAAVPAVVVCLWRGGALRLVAALVVCEWAMLIASPMVLARFFLPVIPALAVCIAASVERALSALPRPRLRLAAAAGVTAALVLPPLAGSVQLVSRLGRDDTRMLAGAFIARHLPAEARLVSWGAPPEPKPLGAADYGRPPVGTRRVYKRLAPSAWRGTGITHVVHHAYPLPYSSDPLPAVDGLELVATFSPFDGTPRAPVLEPLDAFYLPLAGFDGIVRPGPTVRIYRYRPAGTRDG